MFVLSPKAYEFLKNLVQLILPAAGTLYFSLAGIWGLPAGEKVVGTLAVLATFLGVILKISSRTYDALGKAFDGDMVVDDDGEGPRFRLELETPPEEFAGKDKVSFKVVRRQLHADPEPT